MSVVKQPVDRIHEGCAPLLDPSFAEDAVCSPIGWMLARMNLRARMFFPDPVEAERYVDALIHYASATLLIRENRKLTAAEIAEAEADMEAFYEVQRVAYGAGAQTPAKSGEERWIHAGLITAHLLLIPLAVQARSGKKVGRRAAFRVLTAWLCDRNGMLGAKERSLQQTWQKYQSVAHLWATYHLNMGHPKSKDELICFLAVADHIRQLGENHRPERSRETLLDPRVTWHVAPELRLPTVTFDWSCIKLPEKWMHKATEACSEE